MEIRGAQADRDSYLVPASFKVSSHNRADASFVDLPGVLTSGQLRLFSIPLPSGFVLTKMGWVSGTTAMAGPTNYWACLLDPALRVLATSADLLAAPWGANSAKNFSFASHTLKRAPGTYYAGIVVNATTPPSLLGTQDATVVAAAQVQILSGNSSAGLSTPAGLPIGSIAGRITPSASKPWVLLG